MLIADLGKQLDTALAKLEESRKRLESLQAETGMASATYENSKEAIRKLGAQIDEELYKVLPENQARIRVA